VSGAALVVVRDEQPLLRAVREDLWSCMEEARRR
jgi:hypothetical protein